MKNLLLVSAVVALLGSCKPSGPSPKQIAKQADSVKKYELSQSLLKEIARQDEIKDSTTAYYDEAIGEIKRGFFTEAELQKRKFSKEQLDSILKYKTNELLTN